LNQFLTRRKLKKYEFLSILKSLINGLKLGKQYLLQGGSFILHSDYIYINPATLETAIAYLPIASDIDEAEVVKSLLIDLTVYKVSFESPAEGDFIYELLNLLKSENFGLKQLDKLINSMATKPEEDKAMRNDGQQLGSQNKNDNRELLEKSGSSGLSNKLANISFLSDSNIIVFIFLQLFFIALAALLIRFLYLQNKSLDISAIGGIAIIMLALDALVIKRLRLIENIMIKTKDTSKNTKVLNVENAEKHRDKYLQSSGSRELTAVQQPLRQKDPIDFETSVLSEELPKLACLIGCGESKHEKIYIDKLRFTFGRIRTQCDFLSGNRAVGKLHAEIIYKDGVYYIKDLNTRNGTYINGERIVSNVEHSINNHDRIAFANSEYEFHLS
jgi:hypothetical protein